MWLAGKTTHHRSRSATPSVGVIQVEVKRWQRRRTCGRTESQRPGTARRVPRDVVCRKCERIKDTRCRLLQLCSRMWMIRAAGWQLFSFTWPQEQVSHWVFSHFHSATLDGEPALLTSNTAAYFFPVKFSSSALISLYLSSFHTS